jgi:hypoxanthine phosphoribosyltransferase
MAEMSRHILFSRQEIQERVKKLAERISQDYAGRELIMIGILKGAFIFMADLIREINIPCTIDFARLASYGTSSDSSGKVVMTKDIETFIQGRDVLIVEDILDTGLTLQYFVEWLRERSPASMKICVLLDKRKRRKVNLEADYVGFTIDDGFVVGYGLDFNEKFRFSPDIYIIQQE